MKTFINKHSFVMFRQCFERFSVDYDSIDVDKFLDILNI